MAKENQGWNIKTYYWSEAEYLKKKKIEARKFKRRLEKILKLESQIFEVRKQILEDSINKTNKQIASMVLLDKAKKKKAKRT